jgi:hypothetical protein
VTEHHVTGLDGLPVPGRGDLLERPAAERLGPAHDVFGVLAGLAATGAEAPLGLVVLGESDLVRLRPRREARLSVPVHGTPVLRELLARVVAATPRLAVVDLDDPVWGADPSDPLLCGLVSLALVPVRQGGRVVGVLGAADTLSRPWSADELAHLVDVAAVVEHELSTRARGAVADRVLGGWDSVASGLDGATRAVRTLVREADVTGDPALRARAAHVGGHLDALAEAVQRLEGVLGPGRQALAALSAVDLRWGVTAAVRAVAAATPGVRVRPRLHRDPLPALADPAAVRSGVIALLQAVTLADGTGDVHVGLDLVPGSAQDPAAGPVARLRVEAPGRACDVATLAGAVGRFEAVVRRVGTERAEPASLVVSPAAVVVRGRTVAARRDERGTRVETTWGIDVG